MPFAEAEYGTAEQAVALERWCACRLPIGSTEERAMAAFLEVFAAFVVITAAGCMIAERTMGTHSVLKDEAPSKPPRA